MKYETLIKRAAAKMKAQMVKSGESAAKIDEALRLNFPSLYPAMAPECAHIAEAK